MSSEDITIHPARDAFPLAHFPTGFSNNLNQQAPVVTANLRDLRDCIQSKLNKICSRDYGDRLETWKMFRSDCLSGWTKMPEAEREMRKDHGWASIDEDVGMPGKCVWQEIEKDEERGLSKRRQNGEVNEQKEEKMRGKLEGRDFQPRLSLQRGASMV